MNTYLHMHVPYYIHTWSTVPTLSDVKRNFSVFSLFGGITQRNLTSLSKSIDIRTYIIIYALYTGGCTHATHGGLPH